MIDYNEGIVTMIIVVSVKYPVQVSSFPVFVASLQMFHCLGLNSFIEEDLRARSAISPSSKPRVLFMEVFY